MCCGGNLLSKAGHERKSPWFGRGHFRIRLGPPMTRRLALLLLEVACPIALVAIVWVWTAQADSIFFPPLESVFKAFDAVWLGSAFETDALPSLRRWGIAYVISVLIGVGIGVPMGLNPTARLVMGPVLAFLRTTPPPALLPIAMILMGIGDAMKISMIVLVCVFPVLLSTADGIAEVHPTARDVARTYQVPFFAELLRILLPSAASRIFAGMRTSCSLALTMIVLSEMFGSTNGIGYRILGALRSFAIADMWSGVLLIGLLGYAINIAFGWIEQRAIRWVRGATL